MNADEDRARRMADPNYAGWLADRQFIDIPLPGMPDEPEAPEVPDRVQVTRRSSARLCTDCVADIHVRGVAVAPPPMPQRWQYRRGALTLHLCEVHKNRRLETP